MKKLAFIFTIMTSILVGCGFETTPSFNSKTQPSIYGRSRVLNAMQCKNATLDRSVNNGGSCICMNSAEAKAEYEAICQQKNKHWSGSCTCDEGSCVPSCNEQGISDNGGKVTQTQTPTP